MRIFTVLSLLLLAGLCQGENLARQANDGTPLYDKEVTAAYRKLQLKISIYEKVPAVGKGIRLGIYQAQAACGEGATLKNMERLQKAVEIAKKYDVQLLSFPELYVPGYTLSPAMAKKVAEFKTGPSVTKAKLIAAKFNMGILLPYAEKEKTASGALKYYDSIAIINEKGVLLESYKKTQLYGQQERDNWSFGNNPYIVHKFFGFPVGVLNCYECEFPELSRILALRGQN